MHRAPTYLTDTLPVRGRGPLRVTLHAEDDTLVLAVSPANGDPAPEHPPANVTLRYLRRMVEAVVGTCRLGAWEPFDEVDGTRAGWATTVRGRRVAEVVSWLGEW